MCATTKSLNKIFALQLTNTSLENDSDVIHDDIIGLKIRVLVLINYRIGWFGGLSAAMVECLKIELKEDTEVHVSVETVIRMPGRCFDLTNDHAKVSVEMIRVCV